MSTSSAARDREVQVEEREGRDERLFVAAQSLVVEQASAEAVVALRRTGIRSILLKGPLQQRWLTPAGAPRRSMDVDLLVEPRDVEAAEHVLSAAGYRREVEVTPGVDHHASLWTAPGSPPVEVHRRLWGTETASTWHVLANETERADIGGETVEIPNEAARCLIVALHAAHHGVGQQPSLYDLERAIEVAGRRSWQRAASLARVVGALEAFTAGLALVPGGDRVRAELGLPTPMLTGRLALDIATPSTGAAGYYWLAQQKGVRARARFVARKLVPPADFMRFKHPWARRGLGHLALAYLYRPLWLARRTAPGFLEWRRIKRGAAPEANHQSQGSSRPGSPQP